VAWQSLWEEVLDDSLNAVAFVQAAVRSVERETDELVAQQVLGLLRGAFWRFLPDSARASRAPDVERALWNALERAPTPGRKGAYFSAIVSVTLSPDGVEKLARIWRRDETPRGLPLVEQQYIALAEALALRGVPNADSILDAQSERITNPDRRARFAFVRPAFSQQFSVRDSLFRTFANVENRRRESWVLDAMSAMHHPLRAKEAIAQVAPSLALTAEIQRTGDIFFPLRWLNATLDGHRSQDAADLVRAYLAQNPDLAPRLRGKVLQAADDLFRASTREQ
jgi:aminopeptidase N